jgi:hypothetical protein
MAPQQRTAGRWCCAAAPPGTREATPPAALAPTTTPTPVPALPPLLPPSAVAAVYAISDIHTDPAYAENWAWLDGLAAADGAPAYRTSALIVAGDVAEDADRVVATLTRLAAVFAHVVFVPGNHDLWLRTGAGPPRVMDGESDGELGRAGPAPAADSIEKWRRLEAALAAALPGRVHTRPAAFGRAVVVAPLLSWYEAGWDADPSPAGAPPAPSIFTDFRACRWPAALAPGAGVDRGLADFWDRLNDADGRPDALKAALAEVSEATGRHDRPPLITASHFLPFPACLPERRFLFQPALADAAGSRALGARVASLRPRLHVFGHTHISMDVDAGPAATRCVHWPLRYPAERKRSAAGGGSPRLAGKPAAGPPPALVWDCVAGVPGPRLETHWSRYYAEHGRDPANVTPAPWVVARAGWAQQKSGGGG